MDDEYFAEKYHNCTSKVAEDKANLFKNHCEKHNKKLKKKFTELSIDKIVKFKNF